MIDESLKAQLRQALYDERQHDMHDALAKGITQVDIIDRDAIQAADITPALPAASSDNHKWWLDDGMFHTFLWHFNPHCLPLSLTLPSLLLSLCLCGIDNQKVPPPGQP